MIAHALHRADKHGLYATGAAIDSSRAVSTALRALDRDYCPEFDIIGSDQLAEVSEGLDA